jgi:hypothetical protein
MLVLATAVVADYAVFQLLDVNYFRWYLENGPWIALVVSGVAVAVDLEREPGLISIHPATFLGSCFQLTGLSVLILGDLVGPNPMSGPRAVRPGPIDWIFGALFAIASVVLYVVWLIVIAPVQYFGNIAAGASARLAVTSPWQSWRKEGVTELGRSLAEKMPEGAEVIGLARRPVALTSTTTAGLLFVIGQFL